EVDAGEGDGLRTDGTEGPRQAAGGDQHGSSLPPAPPREIALRSPVTATLVVLLVVGDATLVWSGRVWSGRGSGSVQVGTAVGEGVVERADLLGQRPAEVEI